MTFSVDDRQHKRHSITTLYHHAESHYAECRILFVVILSVVMLSVIMLSVVMLSVTAPQLTLSGVPKNGPMSLYGQS
jgi:hypothetical protein